MFTHPVAIWHTFVIRPFPPLTLRGLQMLRPLLLILIWLLPTSAFADDDLITLQSAHSAAVTVQRLQEALTAGGWTIRGTIDHAAYAGQYGVKITARTTITYAWMGGWMWYLIEKPTIA